MKSVGLLWGVLGLGVMAGCSASTADQDGQSAQGGAAEPEWAKETAPERDFAVALKIQPIPDSSDEADSAVTPASFVKPFPEDSGESPVRVRRAQRSQNAH